VKFIIADANISAIPIPNPGFEIAYGSPTIPDPIVPISNVNKLPFIEPA